MHDVIVFETVIYTDILQNNSYVRQYHCDRKIQGLQEFIEWIDQYIQPTEVRYFIVYMKIDSESTDEICYGAKYKVLQQYGFEFSNESDAIAFKLRWL